MIRYVNPAEIGVSNAISGTLKAGNLPRKPVTVVVKDKLYLKGKILLILWESGFTKAKKGIYCYGPQC